MKENDVRSLQRILHALGVCLMDQHPVGLELLALATKVNKETSVEARP